MSPYPSIPSWARVSGLTCYVFDKLDGSHIRAEVNRKGAVVKYGKRDTLLDDQTPFLREAERLIHEKYGDVLARAVRDQRWEGATFYFEFLGPQSFAGWHAAEPHSVTLIDVEPRGRGFLAPRDFVRTFKNIDTARLLHVGNFTKDLADAVSSGTLEGMSFEGVVAKGLKTHPGMFKWKNLAWLERLRSTCKDEAEFERLR